MWMKTRMIQHSNEFFFIFIGYSYGRMKNNRCPVFWRMPLWACLGNSQGYISGYASYSFGVSRSGKDVKQKLSLLKRNLIIITINKNVKILFIRFLIDFCQ